VLLASAPQGDTEIAVPRLCLHADTTLWRHEDQLGMRRGTAEHGKQIQNKP